MIHRRKGEKIMNSSDKNSRNRGKQLKALLRLIGYMFKLYKFHFIAVLVFLGAADIIEPNRQNNIRNLNFFIRVIIAVKV